MAFCAQTPWLVNKSIQQNILGQSLFDATWYTEVVRACALVEDFGSYPAGDRTLVGSKGITLSGGQKQRIVRLSNFAMVNTDMLKALARAVYSRKPIILLDDIFSGLDTLTEEHISQALFGSNGILRRGLQTVILVTHAVHLLSKADTIILLGENAKIVYQGVSSSFPRELIVMRGLENSAEPTVLSNPDAVNKIESFDDTSYIATFHPASQESDITVTDISRQTGDFQIYRFYLNTWGFKHTIPFVILGALCMGFTPAQSKTSKHIDVAVLIDFVT